MKYGLVLDSRNIRPSVGAIIEDFKPVSIDDKLVNFIRNYPGV